MFWQPFGGTWPKAVPEPYPSEELIQKPIEGQPWPIDWVQTVGLQEWIYPFLTKVALDASAG